ncbi:MAG: sialidase family protein [Pseudomonadota bacterium]
MRSVFWTGVSVLIFAACANSGGNDSKEILAAREGGGSGVDNFFWTTERARTEGLVGEWTNLLLDSTGIPIVTHMEISDPYQVHLSSGPTGAWTDSVVGTSNRLGSTGLGLRSGKPVVSFFDGSDLRYFENGIAATVESLGVTGDWPSLAISPAGRILISFQRCYDDRPLCNDTTSEIRRELRIAYSDNGTTFTTGLVEPGDYNSNSGFYTKVAMVGGSPIVAFYNRTQAAIKVAKFLGGVLENTASWKIIPVATARGGDSIPALAVSSTGLVAMTYQEPAAKDLYYTESTDGGLTWSAAELVDRLGDIGTYSALAFDKDGHAAIVYYDGTDYGQGEGLKIAWKKGDTWIAKSIVRGSRIGQFPSIAFGSDGKPVTTYSDGAQADLMYSVFTGSAWPPDVQP